MEVYRIGGYPQKNGKLAVIAMMSYTIIHVHIYICIYIYIYSDNSHGPHKKKKNFTSCDPHHDIYTFSYWQILWHSI